MNDEIRAPRMTGKKVLVTGSGTGIGREVALEFGREGAEVVLHYSHSKEGAASAVEQLHQLGVRAAVFQADFARVEEVRRLGQQTLEFLGGVDALINNAGITMNRPFEQVEPEQFDRLYQVNVRAPFFLTQTLLPALVASRGAVINLSSVHAFEGYPEHSVYAGTKGALVAYTRELAIELALKGVRVNAIAPGSVVVENHYKAMPDLDLEAGGRNIPCGFVGVPLDIARVAVFLASPDARYIVGQTLIVDGGTTSWMPFSDGFRQPMGVQFGKGYVPGL
ncbi:MAG: SDR family oxidoreductase [Candidatus Latescibacteria bacterium]|nr:SDR family oxidoreductase [Candidatus Latescibacterota bacterium]